MSPLKSLWCAPILYVGATCNIGQPLSGLHNGQAPAVTLCESSSILHAHMQACLLHYAKGVAEKAAEGQAVLDVAISVPPFFGPAQRQAIIDAAEIAGQCSAPACARIDYQLPAAMHQLHCDDQRCILAEYALSSCCCLSLFVSSLAPTCSAMTVSTTLTARMDFAGLNVLSLVNSHVAAALQFGYYRNFENRSEIVLLYDLGATSTSAALVRFAGPSSGDNATSPAKGSRLARWRVPDLASSCCAEASTCQL